MEAVPVPGLDDEQHIRREMIGRFDAPAFIRRARRVEQALEALLALLAKQRLEKLEMVRLRLGQLAALAGDRSALSTLVPDAADLASLQTLHDELRPELRLPLEPTQSGRVLRGALQELVDAMQTFNRRWARLLQEADLGPVNNAREGYNRYYLLEKECALGSARVARERFRSLPPLTLDEIRESFPPLRIPALDR